MKAKTILISLFFLFIAFELINTQNLNKKKPSTQIKRKMDNEEYSQISALQNIINKETTIKLCKEATKPSGAFTAVLMVYMVLIIAGAVLVLIFLKEELEK